LKALPLQLARLVAEHGHLVAELAYRFENTHDLIFLGQDINYPIAFEGPLKMKEVSYIHAEAYPDGDMTHGLISLLDARAQVLSISVRGTVV
jgi:glucosamine--fructose-6-phosphate aminotransferase (isomerizing)